MEVKDTREISTNLKLGLAVALSLGGALYTYHKIKNTIKFAPGNGSHLDSRVENGDDRPLQNSLSDISSNSRRSGERECFVLAEYNGEDKCLKTNTGARFSDVDFKCGEEETEHEREIRRLRNRVKILEEKERNLELQLLEYYGIKEQETAVIELQNRLRLNTMEAKLYNLKIESLLLDNRRLEAQAADHANAAAELETAKSKIKILRKKLKSEGEKSQEQILKLQERLVMVQDQEKRVAEVDRELKMQLEEACEVKLELEEMKKCNEILKLENIELAQKLEYVQMLAENAVDNEEMMELKEESRRLKEENEGAREEVERLRAERSAESEELIFLRWINVCLRNELKNYDPAGKTIPRDLSPTSEARVKKLLLEYANRDAKPIDSNYLESEPWSSSDDMPNKPGGKPRLFGKLRRLLLGKSSRRNPPTTEGPTPGRLSCDFPAAGVGNDVMKASRMVLSRSGSRRSFDVPRSYSRGNPNIPVGGGSGSRRSNVDDPSSLFNTIEALAEYPSAAWSSSPSINMQGHHNQQQDFLTFPADDSRSKYSSPNLASYDDESS